MKLPFQLKFILIGYKAHCKHLEQKTSNKSFPKKTIHKQAYI